MSDQQPPAEFSPTSPLVKAGLLVGDKYLLEQVVGHGGMGAVWAARHAELEFRVAVKFVAARALTSPVLRDRFLREAKTVATLRSRYVVQVFDTGELPDGTPYMVMELLEGESLEDRLSKQGKLPLDETIRLVQQAGKGLAAAHTHGIVHRDVKPANIFLSTSDDDEGEIAKMLDFGVAKLCDSAVSSHTQTGALLGTPVFMAPEQARGLKTLDHRADIYALGAVVYRMLTGLPPFDAESFGELILMICTETPRPLTGREPDLPSAMQGWFEKACARNPNDRYQTVRELLDALVEAACQRGPRADDTPTRQAAVPEPPRDRVLLVEDGKFFASVLTRRIESDLGFEVTCAASLEEAARVIEREGSQFFVALADLKLPDADQGQIVDLVVGAEIPCIVFTGDFSSRVKEKIWRARLVDYILKEGPHNVDYAVSLVKRIHNNRNVKVLVVDDSPIFRRHITSLLRVHQYDVVTANNGYDALEVVAEHPTTSVVITDYNMPGMDGYQLANKLRRRYGREDMVIIGISTGDGDTSTRFIKNGANDFIHKPFTSEEFYCRVTQNVEMMELVRAITYASTHDHLTGLCNRRHFFDEATKALNKARRTSQALSVVMADIDFFKKINDIYGHDGGDVMLKHVAQLIAEEFAEPDLAARFGGEEFCVMCATGDTQSVRSRVENLRRRIESAPVVHKSRTIRATASFGMSHGAPESLGELVKQADVNLYEAKTSGRNRVVG